MLGNHVLHYPLTDFAVSLLALAALVDVAGRVLRRPQWSIAVDWLLYTGFAGAVAAVGSGLWLVYVQNHPHDETLSLHHYFAYGTLATSAIAVAARLFQGRVPKLGLLRTAALVISAGLVSGAGFVGGTMAHPAAGTHTHTHGGEEMNMDHGQMEMGSAARPITVVPEPIGSATSPAAPTAPAGSAAEHDEHTHTHSH